MYLVVKCVYVWVGGGAGTEGITLADESFGGVREIWNHFEDAAAGDVILKACRRMRRNTFSSVVQEEGSSN